ncbi:hypothetical protein NHJ13734_004764 [Beauveria thailandica]
MAHRGNTPRQDRSARSRQNTPRTPRQTRSKSWDKSLQIAAESGPVAKASLIDSISIQPSERSKPPEDSFGHEQARTATLVAGVAYDARAIAWPVRADTDMDTWGIESHGQYTKFLAVVEAPNLSRDYVPDMGKEVEMYFDVEYKFEKIPVTEMWPKGIDKVVNEFSRKFQDARAAYSYTPNADGQTMDKVMAAKDVSLSKEELDKIRLDNTNTAWPP